MKTIRMPKKLLAKWLNALRGGTYAQARETLYDPDTCGFCCLGVLQHVASRGYIEVDSAGNYEVLPSVQWLHDKGIQFLGVAGEATRRGEFPFLDGISATGLNDSGMTFTELADLIERNTEAY